MTLDPTYLEYARRGYGMDHDLYDWSMLTERQPVTWPGGKRVAVWINVALQYFPLNQRGKPFPPPGGMSTAYPDLRHYTLREYGNRVGVFRILKAIDGAGLTPTFAFNARLAERNPYLLNRIAERGDEILCHGWHMDAPHYGGMAESDEEALVSRSLELLRRLSGQAVTGWLSPGKAQSSNTPALLVKHGVDYMCDWVNDDMPYRFRTRNGPITALPLSTELEDRFILVNNLHSESEYADQLIDAFDFLAGESTDQGGRLLAMNIHPWLMGQPHRIGQLERVLTHIASQDSVWSASAADIRKAWLDQQDH